MEMTAEIIALLVVAFVAGYLLRGAIAYIFSCRIWSKASQAHYELNGIDVETSHDKYRRKQALDAVEYIIEKTSMENAVW